MLEREWRGGEAVGRGGEGGEVRAQPARGVEGRAKRLGGGEEGEEGEARHRRGGSEGHFDQRVDRYVRILFFSMETATFNLRVQYTWLWRQS